MLKLVMIKFRNIAPQNFAHIRTQIPMKGVFLSILGYHPPSFTSGSFRLIEKMIFFLKPITCGNGAWSMKSENKMDLEDCCTGSMSQIHERNFYVIAFSLYFEVPVKKI